MLYNVQLCGPSQSLIDRVASELNDVAMLDKFLLHCSRVGEWRMSPLTTNRGCHPVLIIASITYSYMEDRDGVHRRICRQVAPHGRTISSGLDSVSVPPSGAPGPRPSKRLLVLYRGC